MVRIYRLFFLGAAVISCAAGSLWASPARADMIFDLGRVLNGTAPAGTGAPWLTVELRATDQSGVVAMTLRSHLNSSSEFISQLALNIAPAILPSSVAIMQTGGSPIEQITMGQQDAQNIVGSGNLGRGFDFLFHWPTSNGANRFDGQDVATFSLTRDGLSPEDFHALNAAGTADIAAKVQGIAGNTSGVIQDSKVTHVVPVPEPATLALLGIAGLAVVILATLRFTRR